MKCCNCNKELNDNAKFCTACGTEQVFTDDIIKRAMAKDQDAIAKLYNQTYNSVYQTVKSVIKDEDSVMDIVQDTFIKGFNNLDQLENTSVFRAWIKRIGVNTAKDYLKKKRPVLFSEMESEDEDGPILQFEDDRVENLPEAVIDQKETARLVAEILDTLSDDQKLAITMFYFNEMSVKEIADELGCSENTVKSRLNYGRSKIKTQVEELEKKGTKLYGLAPIPFLLLLFRKSEVYAAELPNENMLTAIKAGLNVNKSGAISGGKAVNTSAKAVKASTVESAGAKAAAIKTAGTAAGAAAKGISVKLIAGIIAAVVVVGSVGGVAVAKGINSNKAEKEVAVLSPKRSVEVLEAPVPDMEYMIKEEEERRALEEQELMELEKQEKASGESDKKANWVTAEEHDKSIAEAEQAEKETEQNETAAEETATPASTGPSYASYCGVYHIVGSEFNLTIEPYTEDTMWATWSYTKDYITGEAGYITGEVYFNQSVWWMDNGDYANFKFVHFFFENGGLTVDDTLWGISDIPLGGYYTKVG